MNAPRFGGHPPEVGPEAGLDLLVRAPGVGGRLDDRLLEPAADVLQHLAEQLPLGPEVLVQHGLGDPGGLGHLVHRRAVQAMLGEHVDGHVEQLAAPFGGRKPDGASRGISHGGK